MVSKRRTVAAAQVAMLALCVGLSGCVTTADDVVAPSTVRLQKPSEGPPSYPRLLLHTPVSDDDPEPEKLPNPKKANGKPPVVNGKPPILNGKPPINGKGPIMMDPHDFHPGPGPMPTELNMYSHPPYTVAPPDVLLIDAIRMVPRPPYRIEPLEVLFISVPEDRLLDKKATIGGPYVVSPEGMINFGSKYGAVRVGGLTLDEAQAAIRTHLEKIIRDPDVTVALVQFRGMQQIRGEHLVRPDGTISLGTYGCVYVAGMTIGQIKAAIENHLSRYLINPQISVDVGSYNSKKYYVIFDGGGFGQQVFELPATGNETVLSAISKLQGLPPVASKRKIWVARPAPCGHGCTQVLPVDWRAITEGGSTCTNYQLFPGDRIFVRANCLIEFDNRLAQIFAPIERILGMTFLATNTVQSFRILGAPVTGTVVVP